MARGTTTSTLTAITDKTKATQTIDGRTGGSIRPGLIASSPRRRQRRLHSQELPSAGRAGSGFPRTDQSRRPVGAPLHEPYGPARTVEGWSVIRGRVRCRSRFVARERRRRELESKPVIDTAASTSGEGHVARYGNVRRVRKVFVGCPATRPLRGQSPTRTSFPRHTTSFRRKPEPKGGAGGSMGHPRRPQSVGNRLVPNPIKPLPKTLGRGANPRTEEIGKRQKGPKRARLNASAKAPFAERKGRGSEATAGYARRGGRPQTTTNQNRWPLQLLLT